MNSPSYLLVLDGSIESETAAEFAWELAQNSGARLAAQHVLDTPAVWGFLAYHLPGFVGSGPYFEAQKKITEALRSVAETVMLAYASKAEGQKITSESYIDEGELVTEICKRAANYALVIIGENSACNEYEDSIANRLAAECPRPVVLVRTHVLPSYGKHVVILNREKDESASRQVWDFCVKMSIPVEFMEKEAVAR